MTGQIVMNKIWTTCFAAAAFCGAVAAAHANPMPSPAHETNNATQAMAEMPATVAQLQNQIQELRSVANTLNAVQAQMIPNQALVTNDWGNQRYPESVGG
jgi:hypothetical protein